MCSNAVEYAKHTPFDKVILAYSIAKVYLKTTAYAMKEHEK